MIRFENLTPDHPLWDDTWALYQASFPEHEQRRPESHLRAMTDPRFSTQIAIDRDERLSGLLFYWTGEGMIFAEHLAVVPAGRGMGAGSEILRRLLDKADGCKVILEIDPPTDDISMRRLRFYQRLGFHRNPYPYVHRSYAEGGAVHSLVVMSWPAPLPQDEFDRFWGFLHRSTLLYKDPAP